MPKPEAGDRRDGIRERCIVAVLCAATHGAALAQGGPPMLADDPETPGPGAWEINTAYTELRTNQEHLRSLPHVDFNYGVGERIQLKLESGWVFADAPDGVKSGLDDVLLGVKWRFLDQEHAGLNVSVYPQLQVSNGTGSVARGVATPGPNLLLPVEVSHEMGRVKLVGEAGYQRFHTEDSEWVVGALAAVEVTDKLELMAEVRNFSTRLLNRGDTIVNVGLRQDLGNRLKLLASIGTGLTNTPGATSFIAYVGIQVILGDDKRAQ